MAAAGGSWKRAGFSTRKVFIPGASSPMRSRGDAFRAKLDSLPSRDRAVLYSAASSAAVGKPVYRYEFTEPGLNKAFERLSQSGDLVVTGNNGKLRVSPSVVSGFIAMQKSRRGK